MTFRLQQPVRFQHCDPAGIVFYPRYFEMINLCVETWCEEVLSYPFSAMHGGGFAIPTATISVDFTAPSRLGDVLEFSLEVEKVGRTSVSLAFRAVAGEELRLKGSSVLVHVDQKVGKPVRWPEDVRARF